MVLFNGIKFLLHGNFPLRRSVHLTKGYVLLRKPKFSYGVQSKLPFVLS